MATPPYTLANVEYHIRRWFRRNTINYYMFLTMLTVSASHTILRRHEWENIVARCTGKNAVTTAITIEGPPGWNIVSVLLGNHTSRQMPRHCRQNISRCRPCYIKATNNTLWNSHCRI